MADGRPSCAVVRCRTAAGDGTHLDPADVLLVVEVVSPSTRTTDTRRATCAAWKIPVHLVIDPGSREHVWHGDTGAVPWATEAVTEAIAKASDG